MKEMYFNSDFNFDNLLARYNELNKIIEFLRTEQERYPDGKILINKKGKNYQFYLRQNKSDKRGVYISKKNIKTIEAHIQKKYNEELYSAVLKELEALRRAIDLIKGNEANIKNLITKFPEEIRSMIKPFDVPDENYVYEWLEEEYVGKTIGNDAPMFISEKGEQVRSKSELNIANTLFKYKIPYKYEYPLKLKSGITIYPDFTILNVRKRKEIFWEHRGMMDNHDYACHSVKRIKDYGANGIYLGDRLIISEETSNFPLGTIDIENIIHYYFGNVIKN